MRRLPIRTKLAVALAVPLLALITVTVLEVVKTSSEVADISEQTELARAAIGPSGIITALQNERTWLAVELIGQDGAVEVPVQGYEETRAQTDEAVTAFTDDIEGGPEAVSEVFQEPLDGLAALEEVRAEIDASQAPRDISNIEFAGGIFDRYTELIEPFFGATTRISLAVDDPILRQGTELADAVAREIEAMSLLLSRTITDATLSEGGINEPAEIAGIATLHSDFQNYAEVLRNATGPYGRLAASRYPEALVASVNEQIDSAVSTGQVDLPTILAAVNVPRDEAFTGYQDGLHALINDRADELQSAAENRRIWFAALAVLALAVAVVLTWLVSRSITRPLRSLTQQAKEMAEHRLPDAVLDILETPLGDDVDVPEVDPITVRTRDEVADVADALNTVQDSALDLAVEQAVLRRNIADSFVNLGRRNQNLLGRQLDFITELESNETDPDTLASLFRLDHLATRMRRNAESLLVLAGIEPPRKWAAPVRLTDVIRAALGEVEDYQRVAIRGVEPATILGSAAADLAHLMAEFIENALTFSPPDQNVEVRGRHNHENGYSLAVIDQGFGMPEADIAQANRRLSGTESFTIAPSKYLGHYVAGNLASRHGIRLQLSNTPGHQGITASIDLPPGLLTTETPTGDPITDPHGNRAIAAKAAEDARADAEPGPGLGAGAGAGVGVGGPGALGFGPNGPGSGPGGPGVGAGLGGSGTDMSGGPGGPAGAGPGAGGGPGIGIGAGAGLGLSGGPGDPAGAGWPGGLGTDRPDAGGGLGGPGTGEFPPPGPGPARPGGGAPPPEPARTPSGLVKRAPRGGSPAGRTAGAVPNADLLAALSSHTSRLEGRRGPAGSAPGGVPGTGGSPGRPGLPTRQGPGTTGPSDTSPGTPGRPGLPTRQGPGTTGPSDPNAGSPGRPGLPTRQGPGTTGPSDPNAGTPGRPGLPTRHDRGTAPAAGGFPGDQNASVGGFPGHREPTGFPGFPGPGDAGGIPGAPGHQDRGAPPGTGGFAGAPGDQGPRTGGFPGFPGPAARHDPAGAPPFPHTPAQRTPQGPAWPDPAPAPGDGRFTPGPPGAPQPDGRPSDPVSAFLDSGAHQAVPPYVGRPADGGPGRPPSPGPRPDPASGGTTPSGLARRVRGAQMPTTQPLSLRRRDRGNEEAAADPGKDVYGFLSNFTAGVQRGLDEARRSDTPGD